MMPTDTTWLEILRRGDRALYLAKEQGRDRVAVL
jgi:PleD family two-component response regulator